MGKIGSSTIYSSLKAKKTYSDIFEEAITEFLGDTIELVNVNTSSGKQGYEKYKYLKKNVKIDSDLLKRIYDTKYMNHFYSPEEIDSFIRQWT